MGVTDDGAVRVAASLSTDETKAYITAVARSRAGVDRNVLMPGSTTPAGRRPLVCGRGSKLDPNLELDGFRLNLVEPLNEGDR